MTRAVTRLNLGQVVVAERVAGSGPAGARVLVPLTICVALGMTGAGLALPIFARRLAELGAGIGALGVMTAAFALAQTVGSPLLGSLADRLGRRPLLLVAFAAATAANLVYPLVSSALWLILAYALEGVLEAGLVPSAMGVVAAVAPEARRARWVGVVMGGMGAGLVTGPVLGGLLYDRVSHAAPFVAAAACGGVALLLALALVPETRTPEVRRREALRRRWAAPESAPEASLAESLPRPPTLFAVLLGIDFATSFAYAFIEPPLIFHAYGELHWSTTRFGVLAGAYGLAMVLGQIGGGRLGDRWGRGPLIFAGILLFGVLFPGLAFLRGFPALLAVAGLAGLGNALVMTGLSSLYLDLTPEEHRSRVMGIKRAASSLGSVVGPLLVAVVAGPLGTRGVFLAAGALIGVTATLSLLTLRKMRRLPRRATDVDLESEARRALAAQSTLRGIVLKADVATPSRRRSVRA